MAGGVCIESCRTPVDCAKCNKSKAPRGRSVPLAAANGYCNVDCPGYRLPPEAPHLWPGEEFPHVERALTEWLNANDYVTGDWPDNVPASTCRRFALECPDIYAQLRSRPATPEVP